MKRLFYTLIFAFVGMNAWAQGENTEATLTEKGTATGIFETFYFGERDLDRIPVDYEKYDDGTIILKGFANGKDLPTYRGYMDEYGRYAISIPNMRGVGTNTTHTYEGYENYPFPVYSFTTPLDLGQDKMEFVFVDGSSNYNPASDYLVFDYQSFIDKEEYMFYIEFTMPFEGDTDGIEEHVADSQKERPEGIYSINGMRLKEPQKGINIIGGKKVMR